MNASIEQYLWVFVNHQHDDWVRWLPLGEFAANNGKSETTKCTPFYGVKGVNPWMTFAGEPTGEQYQRSTYADHVQATMQQFHDHLQVEMRRSPVVQRNGANRGRIPAPIIQQHSQVWLVARRIRTTSPTRKPDSEGFCPFTVVRQMSPYALELDWPVSIWIHLIQPVSLLDAVASDALRGQRIEPPLLFQVDGEEKYQVSSIEHCQMYRNQLQYHIRLTGYDSCTLGPSNFVDRLEAVGEFHQCYPRKPGPLENGLGGAQT